jgi:hypothetical protein
MTDATRAIVALGISMLGGIPVTWAWSKWLHSRLEKKFPADFSEPHRDWQTSLLFGILERGVITVLTIWLAQSVGPIFATLLAVKAAGAWSTDESKSIPSRVRYSSAIMGGLMSLGWAAVFGILAR